MIRHLPNLISLLRLALVPPAGWLLWTGEYRGAFAVVLIAALSDALDGEIARRFDLRTRFGEVLDPLADKLLVAVVVLMLFIQGFLPLWLVGIVLLRDVVILGGAAAYGLLFSSVEIAPSVVSKINTIGQLTMVIVLLVVLADIPYLSVWLDVLLDPWMFIAVAILTVWSGIDYVVVWSRRAVNDAKSRP